MNEPVYADLIMLAIPGFVVLMIAEILYIRWRGRGGKYGTRDTLASLLMGVGNVVAGLLLGFVAYNAFFWLWEFRLFSLGYEWYVVVLCFVLDDLRYYWVHRIGHTSRWVWASHVNHHSSQHYNLSTALRQTWTGELTGMFILQVPLILLGFHPLMVIFVGSINLIYQFWIHTEVIDRMPRWFEAVFNTPSHHRVHHARDAEYLDANYAGTLIIWDRLFGTFVPEDHRPTYGLVHNLGTFNPIRVAFHEYVGMWKDVTQPGISWGDRWRYIQREPGWSHDGSRQTSQGIKKAHVAANPHLRGKPGL